MDLEARAQRPWPGTGDANLLVVREGEPDARIWIGDLDPDLAAVQLARVRGGGLDRIRFSWSGVEEGKPYYYRIHGPTLLIELDNNYPPGRRGGPVNHIHSVWRDPTRDYGEDLLARHYRESPHHQGGEHQDPAGERARDRHEH